MMSRKLLGLAAFVGTVAASLGGWSTTASGESPLAVDDHAVYAPVQSIRYDFGSKSMSGYFVQQVGACLVTLMVIEKSDPEEPAQTSPARVRLMLSPGQIAGLDSEEGRSLNVTCGDGATTLVVDAGERDRLVALQGRAVQESLAQRR